MEFSAGLIEGCESLSSGGAILLEYSDPIYYGGGGTAGPITPGLKMIGDGTIRNCRAKEYGGGVRSTPTTRRAELTGGATTGCKAAESGAEWRVSVERSP